MLTDYKVMKRHIQGLSVKDLREICVSIHGRRSPVPEARMTVYKAYGIEISVYRQRILKM